ncbi:MAG: SDR family oxidoreductase [Candidatus Thiodiazotropha sp.]
MGVTIVGCGDIGRRLAENYRAEDVPVRGWVRSESSRQKLSEAGIEALACDLDQTCVSLPVLTDGSLFYFAPPPSKGAEDTRVARLIETFAEIGQPGKVVYLSTTGVYGDCQGAWVDETREPAPNVDRARRRLDAEQRWRDWSETSGRPLVILRVAGIYGPGKLPEERLRKGLPMVSEAEAPITNHIHSLDLVRVARAAMQRGPAGAVYNVCDGHPESMTRYFNRVADFLQLPRPPLISLAEAQTRLSPGMLSYLGESRRLSNRKMLEELGLTLMYPKLEQGLPACVE